MRKSKLWDRIDYPTELQIVEKPNGKLLICLELYEWMYSTRIPIIDDFVVFGTRNWTRKGQTQPHLWVHLVDLNSIVWRFVSIVHQKCFSEKLCKCVVVYFDDIGIVVDDETEQYRKSQVLQQTKRQTNKM